MQREQRVLLCGLAQRSDLRSVPSGLHGVPQVPLRLQRQPDLRVPACQRLEQERGVGADGPAALDDGVEPLKRNVHPVCRLDLRHSKRFEELLQEHLARVRRRAMGRQHWSSSVIIGAPHVERVCAFEPEHDPVLIVHAHGVETSKVAAERVQPIPGRHLQILEPRHGVDLIQFPTHDRPELPRDAPSRLAVDAVPDVPRGVIRQRPDHRVAL